MARKSVNLLPAYFRTDKNAKFLSSTIDQLIETPLLERLNGFIGSRLSKNYNPDTDNYIATGAGELRNNYQLEPGLVVKKLTQEISKIYAYDDLINQISFHKGVANNLDNLFRTEFYSYDPQIDWDKLVNFREYYWLPTGPSVVLITGLQKETISTYTVTNTDDGNFFLFTPDGLTSDPMLTLYRGVTYVFNVTSNFPLYIKNTPGSGTDNTFDRNITNNGASNGQIIFTVDYETPSVLYYGSDQGTQGGQLVIKTISENSLIDVEKEIIGKQQFQSGNGIKLLNGLKVRFGGTVTPAYYAEKEFIVEGVGNKIELIDFGSLETPEYVATQYDVDFDAEDFDRFPFDNFKNVPLDPDYILINRASKDLNSWTRYNRWFHSSVLETSALANGSEFILPITDRAKRPIVEFKANLQLLNYGNRSIKNIDLIDNETKDVFSIVEKSPGHFVDGVLLEEGFRVIFNADPDPFVKGRVFEVTFVVIEGNRVINLIEPVDNNPDYNSSVTVVRGEQHKGTVWWLNNGLWVQSQQKTSLNQPPLFDLFDENGFSYSGSEYTSDFVGTKIFGYAVGTGIVDSVLGFPLQYKNVGIESSYLFHNYFTTDTISFVFPDQTRTVSTAAGFLKSNNDLETPVYSNVWSDAETYEIPILQLQIVESGVQEIEVICIDNPRQAYFDNNISIDVLVDNIKIKQGTDYTLAASQDKLYISFTNPLSTDSASYKVLLKVRTSVAANANGTYEAPLGLTNNPLNGPIAEFTLFELIDHVTTMVERNPTFSGTFPGPSNLNELYTTGKYGTRLISSKNPVAFAQHFISDQSNSLVDSIRLAGDQYNQFKLSLIKTFTSLDQTLTPAELLDTALNILNENKNTSFPYLLSGMVPYGTNKRVRTYTVTDSRNTAYSISSIFDPTVVNNTAIIVYLNGEQLVYGIEYTFEKYDTTVNILRPLVSGDVVLINEYLNTDGSYVPPTPTKLGLYPKFIPEIYVDTTYSTGKDVRVIQGHDGSLTVAFNDYRDSIILEFEKRIYNNIKTDYNPELLDINSVLPGLFRSKEYSYRDIYSIVQGLFLKWTGTYGISYEQNVEYDVDNHKTYNYKSAVDVLFNDVIPGSWRAIYKYYFDTDRPDTHPWEMLGFNIKPEWWTAEYGPAPYTSGNARMWADLEIGKTAQGATAGINNIYARPGLSQIIPVDEYGVTLDPRNWASLALNDSIQDTDQDWAFGDWGPAENAWRRSSNWPFACQIIVALCKPATYASTLFDTSRISKNKAGQYRYGTSLEFLKPSNVKLHSYNDGLTITRASGYSVYVIEIGTQKNKDYLSRLKVDLENSTFNLVTKFGGFVGKDKLTLVIDAAQLGSYNPNPFLPQEDYAVHFNTSNPVKSLAISGVIVQKSQGKYVIRGYDKQSLFFKIYNPIKQVSDGTLSVGEKNETFTTWTVGASYQKGQVVFYENTYYRVLLDHKASAVFAKSYYRALPSLPSVGGTRVTRSTKFENTEILVPYGTKMSTAQEVTDFLFGYGNWLQSQGFSFNYYNENFSETINWEFSTKEFLYWSTQNWADNSVITLSPFAAEMTFSQDNSVVDNILDNFYEYSLLKADGTVFPATNFSLTRSDGVFRLSAINTYEGFYFARLNLVQKEHVIVFNNVTVFNDVIYAIESGYRQLRVKVSGFRTANWNGDFYSPGFIYDNFTVEDWKPYVEYKPGEVVRYVDSYYSANNKVISTEKFDYSKWTILSKKIEPQLIPNFDYKINEFQNFYDLDVDNFDLGQQQMSQHLVGYTPRPYLNNIISDGISQYKFYQGFIEEKGTKNSITKLEKASLQNLQGKIDYKEEWAFRVGSYGAYSSFSQLEVPLREEEFVESNQIIQFVDSVPAESNSLISYVTPANATITPQNYNPESSFATISSTFGNDGFVLKTAGYVRLDDVAYTIRDTSALLTITDINAINEGDKFWIGFTENEDWDVYRYTRQIPLIINITQGISSFEFTTDRPHGLFSGEVIAITKFEDSINGAYKITKITGLTKFVVSSDLGSVPSEFNRGVLFRFESVRFNSFDDLGNYKSLADIGVGELFWTDEDNSGKWTVFKKADNYSKVEFAAPQSNVGQKFGYRINKQQDNNTVLVSAPTFKDETIGYGKIYVYTKTSGSFVPLVNYTLNEFIGEYTNLYRDVKETAAFGDTLIFDETDDLIFATSPLSSNVKPDVTGDVRFAKGTNAISPLQVVGLVKISGIDRIRPVSEIPYAVLVSPDPQERSRFGQGFFVSRTTSTKTLLVGAPGQDSNKGVVYRYSLNITEDAKSYTSVSSTCTTNGYAATFDVVRSMGGYSVTVVNSGTSYTTSSQIIMYGTQLGGSHPRNNITINVTAVNNNGSIVTYTSTGTSAIRTFDITTATQLTLITGVNNIIEVSAGAKFGYKIVGNKEGTIVAVSAPDQVVTATNATTASGAVFIYQLNVGHYDLVQIITAADTEYKNANRLNDRFGQEMAINDNGTHLFISSPTVNDGTTRPGKVGIYKWTGLKFVYVQTLNNPSREPNLRFGRNLSVNADASILSITSQGTNQFSNVTYDNDRTTFDSDACRFGEVVRDSGTAFVYNRYQEKFVLGHELFDSTVDEGSYYGDSVLVNDNEILVGSPNSIINGEVNGSVYIWNEIDPTANSWQEYRKQTDVVDVYKIKKSSTIDSFAQSVVDYLDIIDPLKGRISGLADQEIRYKTPFDPAVYNVGTDAVVVNQDLRWSNGKVGQLWWDLSSTKFLWYEQGDLSYRKNTWGKLFPGSTIDIYEWVESDYVPSQWAALADTNEGLAANISGAPRFNDDTVYSTRTIYNSDNNSFETKYYFWVKSKTIVPNVVDRRVSAYEVSQLISDPKSYGLKYLSVIAPDAVVVTNFKSSLIGERIYLNISSDFTGNKNNKHTEWLLIEEDSENGQPTPYLEKKLLDSLLGKDNLGNLVPDPALPSRLQYGIETRPRQSMFSNRTAALRNIFDFTNTVLSKNSIVGQVSFDMLNSKEPIPDALLGEWDQVVEDVEGKNIIVVTKFVTAELECSVLNGKIVSVRILNPGYGYKIAPSVEILDNNVDAKIKTVIDQDGRVIETTVVRSGANFVIPPTLVVRPYTIIIQSDPLYPKKWAKYSYFDGAWNRIQTQKYDTTKYWEYIDWADLSFNELKTLKDTVDELYEVEELTLAIGDYVKVKNPGDNRFIIIRKTDGTTDGTFNRNFDLVYRENGTIKFLDSVWNTTDSELGFDQTATFDQTLYGETSEVELANILLAIKDDIFVGPMRLYWNQFFFKCVKYAFTEQRFLDWAFKTSFINVKNIAGVLDQRTTYKFQNSQWYEDYLKEVKPYRTKIRNYQLNFQIGKAGQEYEPSNTYSTDFDLSAIYDKANKAFTSVQVGDDTTLSYPWKSWADNYTYEIGSIVVSNPGAGYRTIPNVEIIPAFGDSGAGATARAYIASGKVTEIEMITPGSGYTQTPTVLLVGGGDTLLTPAVAYPMMTNSKVRSNFIGIKFDRITANTSTYVVASTTATDIITTVANDFIYELSFASTIDKSNIKVTLDGILVLSSDYDIINTIDQTTGYHKLKSQISLATVPKNNQELKIVYSKHIGLYSAAERIRDYYIPEYGMPGKELSQLMSGAEYPGVQIETMPFSDSAGWDALGFTESGWDTNVVTSQSNSVLTQNLTLNSNTASVASITGMFLGQTLVIRDTLPRPTSITGINLSTGSYSLVTANSVASYAVTATGVTTYASLTATWTTATVVNTGSGALFTILRKDLTEDYTVNLIGAGSNYRVGTELTVTGDRLGGLTPNNDLVVRVASTGTSYGISSILVVQGTATTSVGTVFLIDRFNSNYTTTVIATGTNYTTGTAFNISGTVLGGTANNDVNIVVTDVDINGIISFTSTGTALAGTGARFNVSRSNGLYTLEVSSSNTGTGYNHTVDAGSKLLITGNNLGGTTPDHNLHITVLSTGTNGRIVGISHTGTALSPVITFDRTSVGSTSTGYEVIAYSYVTDDIDLDTVIDGGNLSYTTAAGIQPTEIILDGDAFVSPNTSYAPEELVPGEVKESLAVSVFTRSNEGSPTIVTQTYPVTSTATSTVIPLNYRPGNTSSVMVAYNERSLVYGTAYTVDIVNKTITLKPQIDVGTAAITVLGIGGNKLLGNKSVVVSGVDTAIIDTTALYQDIKSLYVTVNGDSVPESLTTGYSLAPISSRNKRARITLNGLNTSTNVIQTWYFGAPHKAFSEVKEQIIIGDAVTENFDLLQAPGTFGPYHAQAIVEIDGLRALPPNTVYYSADGVQLVFDIDPEHEYVSGRFTLNLLEIHVNGLRIRNGLDFFLDQTNNQIVFDPGFLKIGDVLAITTLIDYDYAIFDGQVVFATAPANGAVIKIITYTNHNSSFIRTEVHPAHASRMYKLGRIILDDAYVWVSVNGKPLVNKIDYSIIDTQTVEIDKDYPYSSTDRVSIMSFSDTTAEKSVGYRIFKDILGRTHYKRYSERHTTYLTTELTLSSTQIEIADSTNLPDPVTANNIPGVILIDGERIEYLSKQGNILSRIRRSTLGTGAKDIYPIGAAVTSQGREQTIPSSGDSSIVEVITATNTTTYNFSTIGFDPSISANDQVSVYYGGKLLSKVSRVIHDFELGYDSAENNSDSTLPPDFVITTGTTATITLSFLPIENVRIRVVKSVGNIWYRQGIDTATDGNSLLYSDSIQAIFLLEEQSGLPDKYQYGQI